MNENEATTRVIGEPEATPPWGVIPAGGSFRQRFGFALALTAITIGAAVIRFHRLDAESLYMDEFWQVGSYAMPVSYVVTRAAEQGYPPLDYLIGVGLDRIGLADSDWWVRFPAACFGVAGVVLFGVWMRRVGGVFVGLTAAALLAICPLHVAMSQEARPYTIFFFFAIATVLTYLRARERNTPGSWVMYTLTLALLLLTRWDGPHFILGGITLFSFATWFHARHLSFRPLEDVHVEGARLTRFLITSLIAVACHNPIMGIILDRNRHALGSESQTVLSTAWHTFYDAFAAVIHGYSPRTLSAVNGSELLLVIVAALSLVGAALTFHLLRRRSHAAIWLFAVVALPFPVLYALTYAALSSFAPKPQYLMFLAVPLFGTVALALDHIRRRFAPVGPRIATAAALLLGILLAAPMTRASLRAVTTIERRDWRGAYTYLRHHAGPEDAFACAASQTIPTYHEAVAPGTERYLRMPVRFLKMAPDTQPQDLTAPRWHDRTNTVWLLVYTNRLYEQQEAVPPPRRVSPGMRVHAFNGLFLIEVPPTETPAIDRLAEGLAALYHDLPDQRSLIAPAIFLHRYYAARGEAAQAEFWKNKALTQARPTDARAQLVSLFDPAPPGEAHVDVGTPRYDQTPSELTPSP